MAIEPIYHRPGLYDEVLPRYEFAGLGDEELLRHELDRLLVGQRVPHALELGCGTGRMTKIICEFADELTCVDNSTAMLEQLRTRHPDLTLVHADARTFVELSNSENPPQAYDLIAACWSLNYPLLACFETNDGTAIVQRDLDDGCREAAAFLSSLTNLVSPGGHLFVFFFDADSAEQHFVTNVWESVAPFPGTGRDFTHRLLLDHLKNSRGSTTTRHHNGTMVSPDFAHAERWFMDGHFKSFPVLADDHGVRESVHSFLTHHTREEGSVRVPAGMYVTTFTRI